ncbi:MAG: UDP-N-acetylglucosamine 2-epimerase (hydrolyzing) [Lachnospiraceae bacterium]|nr:UDP-N-acetylglucosamine 2-epimerase (hydrolyzing) [Lachnospiraceae bacterium]
MSGNKRILFLTGTRADYGKMKPLMMLLEDSTDFELYVYVCGMHLSDIHGSTYREIQKDNYRNIYIAFGLEGTTSQSANLGDTIRSLSGYVEAVSPDMIVVHGDRMDALAGAVVGVLHNILVAHIEGGELSGTMDESIRHAISKFAHLHFVCNADAEKRLIQMGEEAYRIHVIGSPDIDVMMSDRLPTMKDVRERYDISFEKYGILMYHPVTTEHEKVGQHISTIADALIKSNNNYIVIYPNNDLGSEIIINEYQRFNGNRHFRVFPSVRFEYFLSMLKNADHIIGNSSAGVREAGVYGIPAIDLGTRQEGRYDVNLSSNIIHSNETVSEILTAIDNVESYRKHVMFFGDGHSTDRFVSILSDESLWNTTVQKHFVDMNL